MNKLIKYILTAAIVAVGIFSALLLLMWIVLETILEIIKIFLIFSL